MLQNITRVLDFPYVYRLFSRLVTGDAWQVYLTDYIKPVSGEKVLDIGCGPADVLQRLPDVNYTGIDISHEYIKAAKARYGTRGRFLCHDVGSVAIEQEKGTFDLAVATGVLHHLDDGRAAKFFELAHSALRSGGRFITYDGCYVRGQSQIAKWLLQMDRGKFVRTREEYFRLASASFTNVECSLREDLLRIPYTHLIMRCSV